MKEDNRVVFIAIDGSKQAEKAFKFYLEHVHQEGNQVVLGYVTEDMMKKKYGMMSLPTNQSFNIHDVMERQIKWLKNRFGGELDHNKIPYSFMKEAGVHSPGRHLLDMIKKSKASMVIIGTRGMGTVKRSVLGSVSDYVMHHAHVPVCVCRFMGTENEVNHTSSMESLRGLRPSLFSRKRTDSM